MLEPSAIEELDTSLDEQGLTANPVSVGSALLGLARQKGWIKSAPSQGLEWLGDLACEELKPNSPNSPLLNELRERLENNSVGADPRKVAAAILGVALGERWHDEPGRMVSWLERLAIDVVQLSPGRRKEGQ